MIIKTKGHSAGIALIIVLLVIVVLGILAGRLAYSMKVEVTLARKASFDPEMEWLGRSGVEYACYVLAQDLRDNSRPYDALNECWAGGTGGSPLLSPASSAFADPAEAVQCLPMENIELGNGRFSVKIQDLDRKFNINVLADYRNPDLLLLQQALILVGVDASETAVIVDSILDWCDPGTETRMSGTESDDYSRLPNDEFDPYVGKDGPIDDITEMLLIRGITPAMFWGSSGGSYVTALPRVMPASRSRFEEPQYLVGLVELFTPLSGRLVNINTASAQVLQVLPQIDQNIAQAIIAARNGPDGAPGNEDDMPFRSPQEIATRVPGFNPAIAQPLARHFSVRSLVFEAHIEVELGGNRREYVAIIRRNDPRNVQVLTVYWR